MGMRSDDRSIRSGVTIGSVRFIEIRRHSVRDLPDEHLSEAGRRLAVDVGRTRGPFRRVVSSPALRAVETAVAMGFPPDDVDAVWYDLGDGRVPWPLSYREMLDQLAVNPRATEVAARFRTAMLGLLDRLHEGEAALVVAHGGVPEMVAASWCDPAVLDRLGPAGRCMEGVRLGFEGRVCVSAEDLRVPADRTRI
jgi:broad specificity phosphatase PhoE